MWLGDSCTDKKTEGRAEDLDMSSSEGQLRIREAERVWTCAEQGGRKYWKKDDEDGRARQQEERQLRV